MCEHWRDVVGYEGLYQVSDWGRVKSIDRFDAASRRWRGRIMKLQLSKLRRLSVILSKDNKTVRWSVHRLVLLSFIGPCPKGMECRHFPDRDPTNNRLENLQWSTHKENEADKRIHGTMNSGERNGMATIMESQIRAIKKAYGTQREIAERFGISQQHVSQIRRGTRRACEVKRKPRYV